VKAKILFEWLFWVLLSVLLFIAGMDLSVAAPIVILVAPFPIMVLERRQGWREAIIGAAFGSVLAYMLSGPVAAIIYAVVFGLQGAVFGIIAGRSDNGTDFIVMAVIASITAKVLLMSVFTKLYGVNPLSLTPEAASGMVASVAGVIAKSGIAPSDALVKSYVSAMIETVTLLMPSMIILFSALDTLATYAATSFILQKTGSGKLVDLPQFGEWRFPKNIFWALLLAVIADFASKSFPEERIFAILSANLMEVLRGLFMIEGLALCWFYMSARGINRVLKIMLSIFCIIFSPISYILSMVGIFDIWYDLRSRIRRKES
jgi:uncharacterized protein YybS (DUF2232 family)